MIAREVTVSFTAHHVSARPSPAEMPLDILLKQYAGAYSEDFDWPQPGPQGLPSAGTEPEPHSEDEEEDEGEGKRPVLFFYIFRAYGFNVFYVKLDNLDLTSYVLLFS